MRTIRYNRLPRPLLEEWEEDRENLRQWAREGAAFYDPESGGVRLMMQGSPPLSDYWKSRLLRIEVNPHPDTNRLYNAARRRALGLVTTVRLLSEEETEELRRETGWPPVQGRLEDESPGV